MKVININQHNQKRPTFGKLVSNHPGAFTNLAIAEDFSKREIYPLVESKKITFNESSYISSIHCRHV